MDSPVLLGLFNKLNKERFYYVTNRRNRMKQPAEIPSNEFFIDFITQYGHAFDNYDLQTILNTYHTPCFIFKDGTLFANLTEETKLLYFQDLLESYRKQEYASAEIPHFDIKVMGQDSALVTVEWICKRSDGTIAFEFWDAYHLIRIDGNWKILGDTVYE